MLKIALSGYAEKREDPPFILYYDHTNKHTHTHTHTHTHLLKLVLDS